VITPEGIALALEEIAEALRNGGTLVVSDSVTSASALISDIAIADGVLTATATFGEGEANFEWREHQIVAADGTVIDKQPDDHGRKAQGAVWTLDAELELVPAREA
jgi:hypothetical protein